MSTFWVERIRHSGAATRRARHDDTDGSVAE